MNLKMHTKNIRLHFVQADVCKCVLLVTNWLLFNQKHQGLHRNGYAEP